MPLNYLAQRRLKRIGVDRPGNPHAERHVVDATRARHLLEEPQPLLSWRSRQSVLYGRPFKRRPRLGA